MSSSSAATGAHTGVSVAVRKTRVQREGNSAPGASSFPSGSSHFALRLVRAVRSGGTDSVLVRVPGFCLFLLNRMKCLKVMPALGICTEMNYQTVLVKVSF